MIIDGVHRLHSRRSSPTDDRPTTTGWRRPRRPTAVDPATGDPRGAVPRCWPPASR